MEPGQALAVAVSVGCFAAFPITVVLYVVLQRKKDRDKQNEPGSHDEQYQDVAAQH